MPPTAQLTVSINHMPGTAVLITCTSLTAHAAEHMSSNAVFEYVVEAVVSMISLGMADTQILCVYLFCSSHEVT